MAKNGQKWPKTAKNGQKQPKTAKNGQKRPNGHPSSIIHHPSSIIHHPSSIIQSSIIHHPSSIIHHPSSIIHHPSSIIHHPSSIISHLIDCLPPEQGWISQSSLISNYDHDDDGNIHYPILKSDVLDFNSSSTSHLNKCIF